MFANLVQIETRAGEPIVSGDTKIIPMARSLRIRNPGWHNGLVWNRPVAIVVQTGDGQEQVLPVRDVTRQAQVALLVSSLIVVLLGWLVTRRKKSKSFIEEIIT